MDDDVSGLLGALGVGQLVVVVFAVDLVVGGSAGGGEEGPDEVHGRGGEGAAAEAEEEAGDDDEDVLGALLDGRGGVGGGGEGIGAGDLEGVVGPRRRTRRTVTTVVVREWGCWGRGWAWRRRRRR